MPSTALGLPPTCPLVANGVRQFPPFPFIVGGRKHKRRALPHPFVFLLTILLFFIQLLSSFIAIRSFTGHRLASMSSEVTPSKPRLSNEDGWKKYIHWNLCSDEHTSNRHPKCVPNMAKSSNPVASNKLAFNSAVSKGPELSRPTRQRKRPERDGYVRWQDVDKRLRLATGANVSS